ncbi:MAG: 4Fe-4S binding protein [Candidatus Cyclobacteriaceae bacterium M3_2C_046]
MKFIQNAGLAIFVFSSILLIGSLFINNYKLTREILTNELGDYDQFELVENEFESFYGQVYTSKFKFINELSQQFRQINQQVKQDYQITEDDLNQLLQRVKLENNQVVYSDSLINQSFPGNNELTIFKKQQLQAYTSWMVGKKFSTKTELKDQLQKSITDINRDLVNQKGFSEGRMDQLKMTLTKEAAIGPVSQHTLLYLFLTIGLAIIGSLSYILPKFRHMPGIKHNGVFFSSNKNRGWIGIVIGVMLILFYVLLYWFPQYITEWIILVDPVSFWIKGQPASQWFFYGFLYTLAIVVMGIRMLIRYRHSNYHLIRTFSVIFFQTAFAFLIPEILMRLNQPSMDLKNIWPLDYDFFYDYNLSQLLATGSLGIFMLVWGIALIIIAVPVFTYFYGKRWYCSWVCGCGGLAETLGDPYRQLSDKSLKAWKIERWMIHSILVFVTVMTFGVLYTFFSGSSVIAGVNTYLVREVYGFIIGAAFAGVVGVGFYPFMGNRVWCRFGCPLAAYLGLIQRFKSRFRITTNGGQCISCGNCSTYCEMGIDVRWYAQRGQNIIRSSCVGCGVCASVCPRGVLKLENKEPGGRFGQPLLIGNDSVKVLN